MKRVLDRYPIAEFRASLAELLYKIQLNNEAFVITRHDKDVAIVLSRSDVDLLLTTLEEKLTPGEYQRLLAKLEQPADVRDARDSHADHAEQERPVRTGTRVIATPAEVKRGRRQNG
jgi:PHD/YefM family antitoxin component YafN of YafNO toxin-antitoxin module